MSVKCGRMRTKRGQMAYGGLIRNNPRMTRSGHIGHPALTAVFDQPASVGTRRKFPLASTRTPEAEPLLTPAEVASMFRVDPKTVTRWAKAGKLTSIRTLGGHRRYRETEVRALLGGVPDQRESN